MNFHITDAVRKQTTQCRHSYSCLATGKCGDREMCKHEYVDGDRVIFLVDRQKADCPYRATLCDRQLCRCPAHYAILKDGEQRLDEQYAAVVATAREAARRTALVPL